MIETTESLRDCPAPVKLNLFLHVTGRRPDGYHTLQTAFQLLDWGDTLHFSRRPDGVISRSTPLADVAETADLTLRAARLLQTASGCPFGVEITLDKRVPLGSGLGGGSSDAATTLLALNRLWGLGWRRERLQALALTLGADVPFFVFGRNAFAGNLGETLDAIDLPVRHFLVVTPPVQVPTAEIFNDQELTRDTKLIKITDFLGRHTNPGETVNRGAVGGQDERAVGRKSGNNGNRGHHRRECGTPESRAGEHQAGGENSGQAGVGSATFGRNDLQPVAARRYAEVAQVLDWFSGKGMAFARMSGSGASVFAGFDSRSAALDAQAQVPSHWRSVVAQGLAEHPLRSLAS